MKFLDASVTVVGDEHAVANIANVSANDWTTKQDTPYFYLWWRVTVAEGESAVIYSNNRIEKVLAAGCHRVLRFGREIKIININIDDVLNGYAAV